MGHSRLGGLPRTYRWKEVIELLEHSASVSNIAESSFRAASNGLQKVASDRGFVVALTSIFEFVDSVQSGPLKSTSGAILSTAHEEDSLLAYSAKLRDSIDRNLRETRARSDIGELAQNSFSEVLIRKVSNNLTDLFGTEAKSVKGALKQELGRRQLSAVMHDFFATFTRRYLSYYLSRELAKYTGVGRAFKDIESQTEFSKAFDSYVRQSIRITDEFTPGWLGKARYEKRLTAHEVSKFAHVAFKKIHSEFTRGTGEEG